MNPKDAIGSTKPPLTCLPLPPLFEVGVVAKLGAEKYGRHNWRDIPVRASAYIDAAFRHLAQWWEGEDFDAESSMSHLAHAVASLLILRDAQMCGTCEDDRPLGGPMADDWLGEIRKDMRGGCAET